MKENPRHRGYRALLDRAEGDALAMVTLALHMAGDQLKEEAAALAVRAWKLAAGDDRVCSLARSVLSADVPDWHFGMLRDELRIAAYDTALRRAVTPDTRVFEIGTGSGILAMMAARAGAKHVYTCEAVPQIAQAAREIVDRNGFADRISVIGKHSSEIAAAEIGGPADLLVSEIFGNRLLGEDVLMILTNVMGRLVVSGGAIIPAMGRIRVALARHPLCIERRLGAIEGFDLSVFNRLSRPSYEIPVADRNLGLRSDPADLFLFDFRTAGPWSPRSTEIVLEATANDVNGIAQWIALDMDDVGRYENCPGTLPKSAWRVVFHPFECASGGPAPVRWRVHGRHETATLRIWGEAA